MHRKTIRFLALGDSYTIGESVSEDQRWPVQLARRLQELGLPVADPVIVARTGWTTDELLKAIDETSLDGSFDLVSLLAGVNNQYRGYGLQGYHQEFSTLLDRALDLAGGEPGRVVVLSIPDWGVTPFAEGRDRTLIAAQIDRFNSANRQATTAAGARYVDITPLSRRVAGDPTWLAGDGLHPAGKMYAAWVDVILPVALQALGLKARG